MRRSPVAVALVAAALAISVSAIATPVAATPSTTVVISEVYGGGGNSGATLTNDFIELQNVGTADLSVVDYSVQYISASPGAATTWQLTALTGSVPASGHFLIQEAAGAGGTDSLPPPDATGSINMSGTSGTVALVHSTTALTCKTAADCAADSSIVDLVGYGTAAIHEGAADAPAANNATSVQRAANGADTDSNDVDFTAAAPTPTNSGTSGGGSGEPGPLRIHDIQGSSWVSPQAGNSVTNVPGIVTALRTASSKGFWIQDSNPDSNAATSEGIFVFTSSSPTVTVGDSVLVSGKVSDFYPLSSGETVSTTSNLSTTEIGTPEVTVLSHGNPLPSPVVLGADTVPDTYAPDLGGRNIESTPITRARSALDFYESIEGMRVEVDDARVVGPSNTFGEQYVTTKPDDAATYRGGAELLGENRIPAGRLEIASLDGSNLDLDVADVLGGATIGPLDWSNFGGYVLEASTLGSVEHNDLPRVTANPGTKKQLSIATYNVENLAPSDSSAKFAALARGIVTNLASPDVVALEEIQDNTGATDDGVVAANQTLDKLTAAVTVAGGPSYAWREVDPVNDEDGGQPGGNIRVAFLFNPARVSFVDAGSSAVDRSTTGTQVTYSHGVALTLSPGRVDPTNPVWTDSRKPLAGMFTFNGKRVIVIANHFDSKGGDQNADGRFQYPAQSSAIQRAGQAQVLHDFVANILAADKKTEVVVVGDLNDYQFSPALAALRTGTADGSGPSTLTDLITTLPVNERYTYVFNGVSQVLDHILVSPTISGTTYQVVHVNAEYHDQVSDHDPQVLDFTP
ncbi:MAG TPA: endonuclease/exonuclease/phosphatase family protein [Candidatus Limnocylindrales bacterium]|nr:endonuclease/exonuclease/phosphatase family protein [Candidatus Limnocylindrales bacterium]